MSVVSSKDPAPNTSALFARTSRLAERVIVPLNDAAIQGSGDRPAFFCVHSVSGAAGSDLADLARRLEPAVRFYGIQAPFQKMANADFSASIESIADHYTGVLVEFQPEGPYLLGGHCAGAIIALEIANQLRTLGREVRLLIAIDAVPENTRAELPPWNPLYLMEVIGNWPGWIWNELITQNWALRTLARRVTRNAVLLGRAVTGRRRGERLRGGYAIDEYMELSRYPPDQRYFINRLYGALFFYTPAIHPGRVVVYEAKIKPLIYSPQMRRTWSAIAPQTEFVAIAGNHLTMLQAPFVESLSQDIGRRIASAFRPREAAPDNPRGAASIEHPS